MFAVTVIICILLSLLVLLGVVAIIKKPDSVYANQPEQQNNMAGKNVVFIENENDPENADGVRGHLEATGESRRRKGFYENVVKRFLDVLLSFGGLVALSPVFAVLTAAILIDDPGPILFTQKRIGKDKQYFKLHKFRSITSLGALVRLGQICGHGDEKEGRSWQTEKGIYRSAQTPAFVAKTAGWVIFACLIHGFGEALD